MARLVIAQKGIYRVADLRSGRLSSAAPYEPQLKMRGYWVQIWPVELGGGWRNKWGPYRTEQEALARYEQAQHDDEPSAAGGGRNGDMA